MSGLGLHCLPMSHKKDARLIWVKKCISSRCDVQAVTTCLKEDYYINIFVICY